MNIFKKTTLALAISALAGGAMAQSAPAPAPEPEKSPITANVTVVNDYRYRGISQSNFKPAIQGGFDYAHESGFYIGNWNSSISWISDANGANGAVGGRGSAGTSVSAPVEMDFYAGFKKELIGAGFASDIGVLQYYYPSSGVYNTSASRTNPPGFVNPNTTEIYIAQNFTFGALTGFVKFSYAVSTLFGNANSQGSYYPDLTLNYDTGIWGLTLNGHVGYQYVAGNYPTASNITYYNGDAIPRGTSLNSVLGYTDWKLGVTKDFGGGLSLAVSYVDTNAKTVKGYPAYPSPQGKNLGGATGIVALTKTF
jgi:uncharacterized protein (TIGR02001 family)